MKKLYVVNSNEKRILLEMKSNNPNLDFDIILSDDLKNKLLGTLNNAAIIYLKKDGFSFSNAKKIKKYIIPLKNIDDSFINFKKYYELFDKMNYIEKTKYFDEYLKNKEIILYPSCNNKEIRNLLSNYKYKVKDIETRDIKRDLYVFNTLNDSCLGLYSIIVNKIKSGISVDKIKIVSNNDDFINKLKSLNNFYKFPFIFEKKIKKSSLKIYQIFKDELKNESLSNILLKYQDNDLIKEFIRLYIELKDKCSDDEIIEYIDYASNEYINYKTKGLIEFVDKSYIPLKDEVLIIPCFVSSIYPNPKGDNSYPSDKEFIKANLLSSKERNEIEKIEFKQIYYSEGEVIFLKYKEHLGKECYASLYEDFYDFNVLNNDNNVIFNKESLIYNLVLKEDKRLLYGKENPYRNQLLKEYPLYRSYDNSFKTFDKVKNNQEITISYSSLKKYIECPFEYYLNYILKIDRFEGNYSTRFGTLSHNYIEDRINNIENDTEYYLNILDNKKEKLYAKRMFPSIVKAYEIFDEFVNNSNFSEKQIEKEIKINITDDISLYGKLDCILFDKENNLYSIVDFKTGKDDFNKDNVKYGENLQLPIYLLLAKDTYTSYNQFGSYIFNICNEDFILKDTIVFKFKGITINNDIYEEDFNKKYIYSYKKRTIDINELNSIIDDTKNQIISKCKSLKEGDFSIRPRMFDKSISCKYCSYNDICFNKENNFVMISKEKKKEDE